MPRYIDNSQIVTLTSMGNIKQVSVSSHINKGATIQPLSKEKYVLLSTGEVKQIEHHAKDRTENLRNLQKQ